MDTLDSGATVLPMERAPGKVWLVGAGPGDPDLLTLKAARLLAHADVVVHDNLVSDEVLACIGAQARRIYAGKQRCRHALTQDEINALLVRLARQVDAGLIVVGTHGRIGPRGQRSDSVAAAIGRMAPCPVITVGAEAGLEEVGDCAR